MPLDHYVSQVHLRNFYSPALGERMHAIRKSNMRGFICRSEDVCRTKDGSTNKYLDQPRAIEELLRCIEPNYNASLDKLRNGNVDREAVFVIAGFVAYVATCSPAAMRLRSGPLRGVVETEARLLDEMGKLPRAPPDVLGGKSLTELLAEQTVSITIDGKFPQAIGISNMMALIQTFGNFAWEVILNPDHNSFFSSDYPAAIEPTADPLILNKLVPLAPDVAVRIIPDREEQPTDLSFSRFRYRTHQPKRTEVREINRQIVRCAETLVFYRDDEEWVRPFVERNRRYRIEPTCQKIPTGKGYLLWNSHAVVEATSVVS